MSQIKKSGYVALIGRPNVGKSTLLNQILKQKVSITSRKPQTTRHRILGIYTTKMCQAIFVDTPGIHQSSKRAINRYMNKAARSVIEDVDVIIFMVDARRWTEEDDFVLKALQHAKCPVILALNKVDRIKDKDFLMPLIQSVSDKMTFKEVVPLSALRGENVERLESLIDNLLPEGGALFPEDQITDRSERFMVAELIREKLMRVLGDEIPYSLTVEIEQFKEEDKITRIAAIIWVERAGQKAIVIGKDGARLKEVGMLSRLDMEKMFEKKVFLQLWVKVKRGWSDDERALQSLGYES